MPRRSEPQEQRERPKDVDVGTLPKISETLIAFAQPLVQALEGPPSIEQLRSIMTLAMIAWNLPVYERIGDPEGVAMREMFNDAIAQVEPEVRQVMSDLMYARLTRFAHDPRLALVEIREVGHGEASVVATASLPQRDQI
jgi:hypothetical protein